MYIIFSESVSQVKYYSCNRCFIDFECIKMFEEHVKLCNYGKRYVPYKSAILPYHVYTTPRATLYRRPDKNVYIEALCLRNKEEVLPQTPHKRIDCEIDLCDDNVPIISTPRSSRKFSKSFSRENSSPSKVNAISLPAVDSDDSDLAEYTRDPPQKASLLVIDITSLLGRRIKDHVASITAPSCPVIQDISLHCRTPTKNNFTSKLRHRDDSSFPNTFRLTRRIAAKYCRIYHMTRKRQKEHLKTNETGLNKESRLMKVKCGRCKVKVKRLSAEMFKQYYIAPAPKPRYLSRRAMPASAARQHITQAIRYQYAQLARQRRNHYQASVKPALLKEYDDYKQLLRKQADYDVPNHISMTSGPSLSISHENEILARIKSLQQQLHNQTYTSSTALTPPSTPPESAVLPSFVHAAPLPNLPSQSANVPFGYRRIDNTNPTRNNLQSNRRQFNGNIKNKFSNLAALLSQQAKHKAKSDIICISSDDEKDDDLPSTSCVDSNTQPTNQSGTSVFKCHLCKMQLICDSDDPEFIKRHFRLEHNIECVLAQKTDSKGQKVTTIVQKTRCNPESDVVRRQHVNECSPRSSVLVRPLPVSPAQPSPSRPNILSAAPKPKNFMRQLQFNSSNPLSPAPAPQDVICLD